MKFYEKILTILTLITPFHAPLADEVETDKNRYYNYNYNAVCDISEKYISIAISDINKISDKIVYINNINGVIINTYNHTTPDAFIEYAINGSEYIIISLELGRKFITNEDLDTSSLLNKLGVPDILPLENGIDCETYNVRFEFSGPKTVKIYLRKYSVD